VSGYTPPSPRNDSAEHIPTTLVHSSPCSRRGRKRPGVGRPHAPPDPVGHTPLSNTRKLGGTPGQNRRQPRLGSYPHFRHLSCSPAHFCESAGLGDDGQLLGEGGHESGSRQCAHEVWWAPACVGDSWRAELFLWETGGLWLVSTERPVGCLAKVALSYYKTHTFRAPPLVDRASTRAPSSTMPLSTPPTARAGSAAARVLALCELWFIIAAHSGVVGAWRLAGVCRAARQGAKEWLRKLPGIVVCGGRVGGGEGVVTSEVWRLDLGALRWERLPDLTTERFAHACCAVRKGVVVLSGFDAGHEPTASVEILGRDSSGAVGNTFNLLPPLSCGPIHADAAIVIDESESDRGQVIIIGGGDEDGPSFVVRKVDLATGVCTAQPSLLCPQGHYVFDCTAGHLPDGRIVCAGTSCMEASDEESPEEVEAENHTMAQVLEPPPHGSPSGASWRWRALPGMSVLRVHGCGCVLSDGRFAVFGGRDASGTIISSCEALTLDADGGRWDTLSPLHEPRRGFACAAIGGCVIVAGGVGSTTAEVYEEGLGRWRRLPCSLPHDSQLRWMGSALI
jgi:hypothetical protein